MEEPAARPGLLSTIDRVLRGHYVEPARLAAGRIDAPARVLAALGVLLGAIYGLGLGCYALFQGTDRALAQFCASVVKVPLLFLATLVVTFPSLYVFSALQRSPLSVRATLRLLLLAVVVDVGVLASLGPVFAFFAASTSSYPFMLLLNCAFFAVGGLLGHRMLRRAADTLFANVQPSLPPAAPVQPAMAAAAPAPETGAEAADAADPARTGEAPERQPEAGRVAELLRQSEWPRHRPGSAAAAHQGDERHRARSVLTAWLFVYGIVGLQMSWLLRPFLGAPGTPFTWFRQGEGNAFTALVGAVRSLFAH